MKPSIHKESTGSDYYPFGMQMPDRNFTTENYRFGFNGKEKDDEVKPDGKGNSLDFGARIYDSRLGRWLSVDPFQKKYTSYSPYLYCADNPTIFKDPNGKDVHPMSAEAMEIITLGLTPEEGKYVAQNEAGYIDRNLMMAGMESGAVSANFKSLFRLVRDKEIVEVYVASHIETTAGCENMGVAVSGAPSTLDEMWGYEKEAWQAAGKTKADYAKAHPTYGKATIDHGMFGITIFGDEDDGHGKSINGNVQVYVNSNINDLTGADSKKRMAKTLAHEAYGHAKFKLEGKPHGHGEEKSLKSDSPRNNKVLENEIYNRENDALDNYDKHKNNEK